MRTTTIISTELYTVESHGNGTAYTLMSHPANAPKRLVFFQGDDASQFRDELDKLECAKLGRMHWDEICDALWDMYEGVSQAD